MHNIHDNNYAVEGKTLQEVRILGFLEPLSATDLGPGKARLAKYHINWRGFVNSVGLCMTMPYGKQLMADLVEGVTGWKTSIFELMKVGDRAMAMARAFNYRQGLTAKDDTLPSRFYAPLESGPAKGVKLPVEDMAKAIELYYGVQGWDKKTGAPTEGQLHELGISWVAELLYPDEAVARRT
jgi:aldehyde:ferredoxin oxidoreductase